MTQQQTSAVVARDPTQQDLVIKAVAGREDVERIEATIMLPPDYLYAIPKYNSETKQREISGIGITADGYDYLNRIVGCTFYLPRLVPDANGAERPNPIVRKDYIRLRLGAVWYNPLGQLVGAIEDVETDFNLVWMDARINARSAEMVLDENGLPVFDAFGNPGVKLSKEDELRALKTLSQLRTFGLRYAQTVARVRLLKMATGLRSLPGSRVEARTVKVVGFRDRMTPGERVETGTRLYGLPTTEEPTPLTNEELASVEETVADHMADAMDEPGANEQP